MAERSAKKLARIHRVRSLQLGQVQAQEAHAQARLAQEAALRRRIDALAANVQPSSAPALATSLAASAHFRERLRHTAEAADRRMEVAQQGLEYARAATREAKRDQTAVEKLIARHEADAALAALRALEALPPVRGNRHDPC